MPIIAIALVLAVAVGGGASFAAQSAVPGDMLYPVKVGLNENVEAAFALSDESKVNFDLTIIKTRLQEANTLIQKDAYNASAQEKISSNLDAHTEDIATEISALEKQGKYSDAANIAAQLKAALAQNETALAQAKATVSGSAEVQSGIATLLSSVQSSLTAAEMISDEASTQAGTVEATSSGNNSTGIKAGTNVQTGTRIRTQEEGNSSGPTNAQVEGNLNGQVNTHL
jgi:hypothetical protein